MVFFHRESNSVRAAWLDGKLPSRRSLERGCSLKRLGAIGIERETLEVSPSLTSKSQRRVNRYEHLLDMAGAFMDNYLRFNTKRSASYQIVLLQPMWGQAGRGSEVKKAELVRYDTERFFPEDDMLLNSISPEEILLVKPYIPYLRETDYFQLLAVYPASPSDFSWNHTSGIEFQTDGPIGGLATYLDINTPPPDSYRNFPIFDQQLRLLLRESVSRHLKGEALMSFLRGRGFRTLDQRVSLRMRSQTGRHSNQT